MKIIWFMWVDRFAVYGKIVQIYDDDVKFDKLNPEGKSPKNWLTVGLNLNQN